ncbi:MAG TPA: Asp-tRNA(Asn)/Glu-tRNA(Gln) amidotransferase subunit GatB [Acidimicrobiia bacterium]|nr:Asp-tRNA(Asn)/Glu-tRNA(Gln) amidotransferase subunit GatB [Acidimicrobiia bacterium]
MTTWETVVGLEVHCELSTASKLFCGCPNEFGTEPNTNVCPVCLGLPGSLPVLNEKAVEYALRVAEALNLKVPAQSVFARKNYFYPDMPKDYQTSQYDEPITIDGFLDVDDTRIGITRAHLEEDTGKSLHVGGSGRIQDADHSLVDYNRAGVPLLEIVSEPDIRSAEQAKRYVEELRATLLAIGVSDVKMEEGSLRIDANVSVRPEGSTEFGTRCEIKNLNSLRSLTKAIEHEAKRQVTAREFGDDIVQETRHWDEARGRTVSGRSKEEAHDYRYFPEPDLVPVAPTDEMRTRVHETMPELPAAHRARLVEEWGIKPDDARVLVSTPGLSDYAAKAVAALTAGTPKDVVNWAVQEVLAYLNKTNLAPAVLSPEMLGELVSLVADGKISRNQGKDVLDESLREDKWPRDIVEARGLGQVTDTGELAAVVDAVLVRNADAVAEFRAADDKGKKKKRGFLMGELMKEMKGQGDPVTLNQLLDERLNAS